MSDAPKAKEGIIDLREAFAKHASEPTAADAAVGSSAAQAPDPAPSSDDAASAAPGTGSPLGKHGRPSVRDLEAAQVPKRPTVKGVLIGIAVGIIALIMVVVVAFVAYMRIAYASFYDEATPVFETPGINSGFIPQDLDYVEDYGFWLFSGYEGSDSPSPVWKRTQDGNAVRIEIENPDGSRYADHGSGITSLGDKVYLTTDGGYLVLPAEAMAAAGDEDVVVASSKVEVGFDPAFLNIQEGRLYAGVFHYEGPYDTPEAMHLTSPDGTENRAVMYAYPRDGQQASGFAALPDAVYSIPDKVQGVAIASDGKMVLSTSWGFAPSELLVYDMGALTEAGTYEVSGSPVPLAFCDGTSLAQAISAPPMMEGIDQFDGRLFLSNEAASNKYVFGKLYGAGTVYFIGI